MLVAAHAREPGTSVQAAAADSSVYATVRKPTTAGAVTKRWQATFQKRFSLPSRAYLCVVVDINPSMQVVITMTVWHIAMMLVVSASVSTQVTFVPGRTISATSQLTASPNSVVADGSAMSISTLTLAARDASSNPTPGLSVNVAVSGGNNVLGSATGTTDGNGIFTTTLASTRSESKTVSMTWFGTDSNSITTSVQFTPGPPSAAFSSLSVNPNKQIANNSNTIVALLTLYDNNGNPISGVTPSFTASGTRTSISAGQSTSASGQSSASYQTDLAQSENILVSAAGLNLVQPVTFIAGPVSSAASSLTASPNNLLGNGSTNTTLVATARDAKGNLVSGVSVAFSASGTSNTFNYTLGITNASGTVSTTLRSSIMQTEVVTAAFSGSATATASIVFTGNANAATSSLVVNPNSQSVENSNALVATAVFRDATNNPIYNLNTSWTATAVQTSIAPSGATDATGTATATLQTTLSGNQNVTATCNGLALTASFVYLAGSPNAANSDFVALPPRQVANNTNVILGTVLLRDRYRNPVAGQSTIFGYTGFTGTSPGPGNVVQTNAGGVAQGAYTTSTVQNANLTASVAGFNYATPAIFTGVPNQCMLTINPNSQPADGASSSAASLSPINVVTNASGQASTYVKSPFAGPNKFIAQAGGVQCTAQGNFLVQTAFCTGNPNYTTSALTAGSQYGDVAVGDFNNDAKLDLAVVDLSTNSIAVFAGTGIGTFGSAARYPTGAYAPNHLAVGDLNADGNQDLVFTLRFGDSIGVLLGAGAGGFMPQINFYAGAGTRPVGLVVADLNGDTLPDLLVGNAAMSYVSVYVGTGVGSFLPQSTTQHYQRAPLSAVGDFNGDGVYDMVGGNDQNQYVSVFLGHGDATFSAPINSRCGSASGIAVGDFNGDGKQDFVSSQNAYNKVCVAMGDGTGAFSFTLIDSGSAPSDIAVADFNGDGNPDVITSNYSDATFGIFLGSSTGTFATPVAHPFTGYPTALAIGDFNGDAKPDLAASGISTVNVSLYSACN
ncbi:hypothetical protein Q3G72_008940 [Acer saccharum]|nr:hypothetical protein Q3G72_008940 [Acer saccharum]